MKSCSVLYAVARMVETADILISRALILMSPPSPLPSAELRMPVCTLMKPVPTMSRVSTSMKMSPASPVAHRQELASIVAPLSSSKRPPVT